MYGGGGEASSSSSASASTSTSTSGILQRWKEIQNSLKERLITEDDFSWKLPIPGSTSTGKEDDQAVLKYIGGVDVSCLKEDQSIACGTLVVLDFRTSKVVYQESAHVRLDVPYIAGFLAFREAPVLLQLLEKMRNNNNPYYPQLVMVDGNGILHPRGFGLACHLGVLANLPTIGIGKKLHFVDGLTESGVKKCLQAKVKSGENFIILKGRSGRICGAAMRSTEGSVKPIFISIGHRISLDTAIEIVKMTCQYRVPEPIRQADKRSRGYVQKPQQILKQFNCLNLEPSVSWKTITGNHTFNHLKENNNQVRNGLVVTGQGTSQGRGRVQGRGAGLGKGRWEDRGQVEKEGKGQREQERGHIQERGEGQSNWRGYGYGRGTGPTGRGKGIGQGRGREGKWVNNCEQVWIRKE
ncbi:uncharacterized protein LOC110668893 isoform X1 [Hevea brasiliensis]|uniref:uncharacterized protein LOC110668893 isoform X1 n=1 Tax=Hevea brasiliensis TaxID=3981 RepID=UPI0025FFAF47|nr:uncharacterized protein LOC110668893 isoform X1 [Hevea brasiliensis]